jgi:redox-sensitive bicupin YhaK (pirin superfamily)
METTMTVRSIQQLHDAQSYQAAPGFSSHNMGPANIGRLMDPFVNLDDFMMDRPIFRAHPHSGFSAITYMFEDSPGSFVNRWSYGEPQIIGPGAFHWTQAGSGMIHEEVPTESGVDCHGLQMFVRLPTEFELSLPEAFHLDSHEVPEYISAGVRVRVLAGSAFGVASPIAILNDLTFLDVHLEAGATVAIAAGSEENAFGFVVKGAAVSNATELRAHTAVSFAHDGSEIVLSAETDCEILVGLGSPLNEPYIAQGPFMLSTSERIGEAFTRLKSGGMGQLAPSF